MKPLLQRLTLSAFLLCAATAAAQPASVLADPTTGELFRPSAATFISGNGLLSSATLNGYFADPSTNGSFSASAWRSDMGVAAGAYRFGGDANFVFVGDSITAGTYNTVSWPTRLAAMSAISGRGTTYNTAIPGDKLADVVGDYTTQVYPHRPAGDIAHALLFVFIGANDIPDLTNEGDAAAYFEDLADYWSQAKADGFTVVAFTILPATNTSITTRNQIRNRELVNEMIRRSTVYDYLIDTERLLPNPGDLDLFLSDGIHITDAAAIKLAAAVNATIASHGMTFPALAVREAPRVMTDWVYMSGGAGGTITNDTADFAFGTGDFSASAWVMVQTTPGGSNSYSIFGGASNAFGLIVRTNGEIAALKVNSGYPLQSSRRISLGRWTLITYVRASGVGSLYIDGALDKTGADTTDYTARTIELGSSGGNGASTRMLGYISRPKLYDRALTLAEVEEIAATGRTADATSLLFDLNTSKNLYSSALVDDSGGGRNVTMQSGWVLSIGSASVAIPARQIADWIYFPGTAGGTVASSGSTITAGTGDLSAFAFILLSAYPETGTFDIMGGGINAFGLFVNTSGKLVSQRVNSALNTVSSGAIPLGRWVLVGYTRSGTTGTYWIDSAVDSTISDSRDYSGATDEIGSRVSNTSGTRFTGYMAYPQFWKRALSATEVGELTASFVVTSSRTSIGFALKTGSALSSTTVQDASGNGHTFTLPSGALYNR